MTLKTEEERSKSLRGERSAGGRARPRGSRTAAPLRRVGTCWRSQLDLIEHRSLQRRMSWQLSALTESLDVWQISGTRWKHDSEIRGEKKEKRYVCWNKQQDRLCEEQRAVIKPLSLFHFLPPSLTLSHFSTKETRPLSMFVVASVERETTVQKARLFSCW